MNGSIAKRYAKALFDEAKEQFVDEQIYKHFGTLFATMKAEPDLQMALINPRVSPDKKYALMMLAAGLESEPSARPKDNLQKQGQSPSTTLFSRFLHLLLKNHREHQLRLIIYVYRDLYREFHEIDRVVFETAIPVDNDIIDRLTKRIQRHTHRAVECEHKVNPNIIGGFRLRIGDHHYDHSYKHQLEQIRQRLCLTR